MPAHWPLCQSINIGKSRRRGLLESVVLTLIRVRPYRCQSCDLRCFRWAAPHGHNVSSTDTASTPGQTFKELCPRHLRENAVDRALMGQRTAGSASPSSKGSGSGKANQECNSPVYFEAKGTTMANQSVPSTRASEESLIQAGQHGDVQ